MSFPETVAGSGAIANLLEVVGTKVTALAESACSRIAGFDRSLGNEFTRVGTQVRGVDADSTVLLGRIAPNGCPPVVRGRDPWGRSVEVDPADVYTTVLRNDREGDMGLIFTEPADPQTALARDWSTMKIREADRKYWSIKDMRSGPLSRIAEPEQAAWRLARSPAGEDAIGPAKPIYLMNHGSKDGYVVNIVHPLSGQMTPVAVEGSGFSGIIREKEDYRRIADAQPESPIVSLACHTGHPDATAGPQFSQNMHNNGEQRNIYSPKGRSDLGTAAARPVDSNGAVSAEPELGIARVVAAPWKDSGGSLRAGTFTEYAAPEHLD